MVKSGLKVSYYNDVENREIYFQLKYIAYSYIIIHTVEQDAVLILNRYEA